MSLNNEMKNAIIATDKEAQYDQSAKRLLSQKIILAHILVKAVEEFKGMKPTEVVPYIVGTPYISQVPMEPGFTNTANKSKPNKKTNTDRLSGFNTENSEINEGVIYFDIIFYVRMKDGISQIIVNIEAQKSEPTDYMILNRAIFYASRLIASQKEREFTNKNYDDIKAVYSIWVCMNAKENTMSHIHLTKQEFIGRHEWKGNLDLMNIVMIGLAKEIPEYDKTYNLHRLLTTLLSDKLTIKEKLGIVKNEYEIPIEDDFRREVDIMCNLSQGIREEALAIGRVEGHAEGELSKLKELIQKKLNKQKTPAQIADELEEDVEVIQKLIHSMKSEDAQYNPY